MALLSIFGLILGIGCGICLKPWVDRHNKKIKSSSGSIAGESGLEAWSSSAATRFATVAAAVLVDASAAFRLSAGVSQIV